MGENEGKWGRGDAERMSCWKEGWERESVRGRRHFFRAPSLQCHVSRPHRKTQPPPVRARFAYPTYQSTNLLHSCTLVLLIGPPFLAGDRHVSPLSACLRLDGDGSFSRIWSSGSGRPPPIRSVSPPLPQHIWPVVGRERSDLRPSIARRSRRRGGQASYRKGNVWISELALFEKFYRESARI